MTNTVRALLAVIIALITFAVLREAYGLFIVGYNKYVRKISTAPKQDQHWEDVKQTIPANASDLDTPERIKERQRIAASSYK